VEHRSQLGGPATRNGLRASYRRRLPSNNEIHFRSAAEAVLSVPTLQLVAINAISPTLAETMRACPLRAGLSRSSGSSNFVLGNPKAWLGTAYHEVLEKIVDIDFRQESLEDAVDRLWTQAVAFQQQRASTHVLNRRFGLPITWRGYYIARASVLLRAQELISRSVRVQSHLTMQASARGSSGTMREQEFTAFGGRLVGRPDVIGDGEVIDYKSGAIVEYDATTETNVIKVAYVRQLRIYGYLVNENLGWWPRRGVLLPLGGVGVEVALEPSQCEQEAAEAIALLESYQRALSAAVVPDQLASPSPHGCRWCPYKLVCPSFWRTSTPSWSGQLDGAAVEGTVIEQPSVVHAGAAQAVAVNVETGSEIPGRTQIAPLNVATHPSVVALGVGDRIRVVGLRARSDGVLTPTQRTVIARACDLPTLCVERFT
jgi:hypothetical protein